MRRGGSIIPFSSRERQGRLDRRAESVRRLGLIGAKDVVIFRVAREADAIVMTKDADFPLLLERFGPPPAVIWIRCGNTSNAYLKRLLRDAFPTAMDLIRAGESLVVITDLK